MPFDSVVTAAVVRELRHRVVGASVTKVFHPGELEIYIHLRRGASRDVLLISAHPQAFRLHLVSSTPPNPPSPSRFCMTLRKYLEGARLEAVEQEGLERTIHLRFVSREGPVTLTAELMGRHSNIVLTDADGRILECIKKISSKVSRARAVLPGHQYAPPPPSAKPSPLGMTEQQIAELLSTASLSPDAIVALFSGISPFTAREVAARAQECTPTGYAQALCELLYDVREGNFTPIVLLDDANQPYDCWALAPRQDGIGSLAFESSISSALERAYVHIQHTAEIEALRRRVASAANEALRRIQKRISAAQEALAQSERAEEYRIAGELLTANLSSIPRGASSIELVNYYDRDLKPITVQLDPKLSPAENAARYFQKHRKAKSAKTSASEQLAAAEQDEKMLRSLLNRADTDNAEELKQILAELQRFVPCQAPSPEPVVQPRHGGPMSKIRRFETPEGWEILFGETKEANDYLTTKIAAPDDLWLHVRAAASAHVVIRTRKRPDAVPHSVLLRAARIAAANSEAKHSSLVPVDYTLKRYVTKPRGSPPGAVLYRNEKTLHVEPER
ncbi:MAG: Rqc2 family fibronectin-binding protein [Armatimonadota bacterium]